MTLDVIKAIFLGIVEGLTEFIPVSSTGHLLLVGHFFGFSRLPTPKCVYCAFNSSMLSLSPGIDAGGGDCATPRMEDIRNNNSASDFMETSND